MKTNKVAGHILALITIIVWGTTVISSTKLLQGGLSSAEIIISRFILAYLLLNIIYPPRLKFEDVKRELTYAAAGLLGVTLYFFLEILALNYTKAANVSVILTTAPFFCGILSLFFDKSDKPKFNFFIGFILAFTGVALVTFEDGLSFNINVKGALFALASAFAWGLYSILTKKIGSFGHNVIATTRRIFMYGLIFMIPTIFIFNINPEHIKLLANTEILFNLLFLGLGASGICFITWSCAANSIGPVKTSCYIYAEPLVTIAFSYFFLKNQVLTWQLYLGAGLIIIGLILSITKDGTTGQGSFKKGRKRK